MSTNSNLLWLLGAAAFLGGLFGLLAIVLGTLITFKGGNGILLIILGFFLRFASSAGAATPATDIEPPLPSSPRKVG